MNRKYYHNDYVRTISTKLDTNQYTIASLITKKESRVSRCGGGGLWLIEI